MLPSDETPHKKIETIWAYTIASLQYIKDTTRDKLISAYIVGAFTVYISNILLEELLRIIEEGSLDPLLIQKVRDFINTMHNIQMEI